VLNSVPAYLTVGGVNNESPIPTKRDKQLILMKSGCAFLAFWSFYFYENVESNFLSTEASKNFLRYPVKKRLAMISGFSEEGLGTIQIFGFIHWNVALIAAHGYHQPGMLTV